MTPEQKKEEAMSTEHITWGEFVAGVEMCGVKRNTPLESLGAETVFDDEAEVRVQLDIVEGETVGASILLGMKRDAS